jgi:hypothetical protein
MAENPHPQPLPVGGEENFYVVLAPCTGPKPRKEEIPRPDFGGGARGGGFFGGLLTFFKKAKVQGVC